MYKTLKEKKRKEQNLTAMLLSFPLKCLEGGAGQSAEEELVFGGLRLLWNNFQ